LAAVIFQSTIPSQVSTEIASLVYGDIGISIHDTLAGIDEDDGDEFVEFIISIHDTLAGIDIIRKA